MYDIDYKLELALITASRCAGYQTPPLPTTMPSHAAHSKVESHRLFLAFHFGMWNTGSHEYVVVMSLSFILFPCKLSHF